ncbi:class I SAM-dependent methyltransferase [Sphingomonas sp.]|uniref:class I SAM-dependent methyltransferase n=1 Tax=Sphingomonas sp. TaxID=28214 RepID=UPI003B0053C0
MRLVTSFAAAAVLTTAAMAQHAAHRAPSAITAALADPGRPAADRERDANRHAADILAFAEVKPGAKVADFIMGGGYWTRAMAPLVGPKGHVYAYQPAEFIRFRAAYGTEQEAAVAGRANVTANRQSLADFGFGEPLDAIVTVQNWHDLHLKMAPPEAGGQIARRLFGMLKPGGVLVVVDHVGNPGATPFAVADTLHRGDAAATRREIEAAGFRFDGELPVLHNGTDPHTALVFDPAIRGKTDQFVYRFRKPR